MATRLVQLNFDAADGLKAARFWGEALGWVVTDEGPGMAWVEPPGFSYPGTSAVPMWFGAVPEPKTVKNRIHLDLVSTSPEDQAAQVERLLGLGATRVDIGQGDVPWAVLADPEGNEFCVLEPRPEYAGTGPVAAIVVDSVDHEAMGRFWALAAGWPVTGSEADITSLRSPAGEGPFLELLAVGEPKRAKNRVHLDVAPFTGDDQEAESARLQAAGGRPADVGQGQAPWIVLADPEGQEFCVLTAR